MDMYDRIDELLKERNMSRRQLAIKAGVPTSTMSNLFARRSESPALNVVMKIAEVLNVSPSAFMSDTEFYKIRPKQITIDMTEAVQEIRRLFYEEQREKLKKSSDLLRGIVGDEDAERAAILLSHFHELNSDGQKKAISYISDLEEIQKYAKPSPLDELRGE